MKNVYPRNVYQIRETLFEKLDSFGIKYTSEQKLFKNLAKFDFESTCVQEETLGDTNTTTWIGKHVPIYVSISSNLVEEPILICNSDSHHLVASFIGALENLAFQSKAKMKNLFLDIETTIKIKVGSILEKLTQSHNRQVSARFDMSQGYCENEICASTHFLQIQKNQLIDLQESLERYCNVLPVFSFKSAKYDLNLIKSFLLPILINERDIEPTVIKQASQFISFKFGDIQLLDIINFHGGATGLDSFLKAYKTSEIKRFFPYEWFDHPDEMQNTELPPYDAFYSKLRSCNPLEAEYTDYVNLLINGLTTEQAVVNLKLSNPPPTRIENYQYLQQIWKQEQMSSFKDFLQWYNNENVVPTLEAMQKVIAFYHGKNIDMLKLGCTLPNLANICLHKSSDAKFYPFMEGDKDLLDKIWEDVVGGPSIVLHAKQLLMKLLSGSLQLYASLLLGLTLANYIPTRCVNPCLPVLIRIGIWTQKRVNSHLDKTRPVALKIWSCLIFDEQDLIVKLRAFTLQADRRKLTAWVLMRFVPIAILCLKQWVAFTTFVTVKSSAHLSLKKISNVAVGKENSMKWDEGFVQEKGFTVIKMWECEWWRLYKTATNVKQHIRENFPYRRSLTEQQLLEGIKKGSLFGYVQWDLEVPKNLRLNFANFPPIFKNSLVSKNGIGDLKKTYAEEEGIMSQPRKMLISSFARQNGTLITPLLLFYIQLGLVCTKIHRFVEYTPKKSFNSFMQSAVDARRQGDENPNLSVVAETKKLLANSSYGYQMLDKSRHTVTKLPSRRKKHMRPLLVHCSKNWIMWTIHCMKLNLPKHRLNTESQSLSVSLFFNTQNCECWSCTTTSSPDCVM